MARSDWRRGNAARRWQRQESAWPSNAGRHATARLTIVIARRTVLPATGRTVAPRFALTRRPVSEPQPLASRESPASIVMKTAKHFVLSWLLCFVASTASLLATYTWKSVTIGGGGYVTGMVVH